MTALDDGLNTDTPLFAPAKITANWLDLPSDYATLVTEDAITALGDQIGPQGFRVTQSLDDGLPDPVTMTSGNDASGSLSSDLVGRPGLDPTATSISNAWVVGSVAAHGTGTVLTPSYPGTMEYLDYHIIAIMTDADVGIQETGVPSGEQGSWTILGDVIDGVGTLYHTWVFGRQHSPALAAPSFTLTGSANWSYVTTAARTPKTLSGAIVPVLPERPEYTPELSAASTSHTTPAVNLSGRGWTLGVFGTGAGAGPWTAGAGTNSISQDTGGAHALLISRSALVTDAASGLTLSASTALSTAVASLIQVPLLIRERPFMDATQYFSPFNKQSPVYGFERDTAPMTSDVTVITPTGPVATTIFTGVMADIPVEQRVASLQAVSNTRIKLDSAVTLPTINGSREGCTTDWLTTYAMAQGGQYANPSPTANTRFWAPIHGSLHPHMDGPNSFPSAMYYSTARTAGSLYSLRDQVKSVDGPFVTAMYGTMGNDYIEHLNIVNDPANWQTEPPGVDNPLTYDLLSQQNGVGRLTFYIRADPRTPTPAALAGGDDYLFRFTLYNIAPDGSSTNYIQFVIRAADGLYVHQLDNAAAATGGTGALPSDGAWHMIGFAWDYVNSTTRGKRNGVNWSTSGHSSTIGQLPTSTADLYARGLKTVMFIQSRLPISDIDVGIGPETYLSTGTLTWAHWRGPVNYLDTAHNATYRPTRQPLAAIAEPSPVTPWNVLQDLAKSTLSSFRVNEADNVEWMPLSYFGETAQMTVSTANMLDTSLNAADLDVVADASKIRNLVTSNYPETRVATSRTSVLEGNSSIAIPSGESFLTLALDKKIAETHGAVYWQSSTPDIQKLTALQVAGTNPIQNENVMSVNTLLDGTGTVITSTSFQARISGWDSSSVTIRFINRYGSTMYLSNNGSGIPFLRILGYEIQGSDAYTTVRDPGSVGLRRLRGLSSDMPWIQDRDTALVVTTNLVSILARPRPQITVQVMGDPRRKPGDLVSLVDASGTRATGNWRVLSVAHQGGGAVYTQELSLVAVGSVAVWDSGYWDQTVWGA